MVFMSMGSSSPPPFSTLGRRHSRFCTLRHTPWVAHSSFGVVSLFAAPDGPKMQASTLSPPEEFRMHRMRCEEENGSITDVVSPASVARRLIWIKQGSNLYLQVMSARASAAEVREQREDSSPPT